MRTVIATLALAVSCIVFPAKAEAHVDLKIVNGRIWLVATNATVGEILDEWSRVGGTQILNGDRVPGAPLTLQLNDVSEQEALEVLLRTAAGYMAVQRSGSGAEVSRFDRILILPTTRVSAAPAPVPVREELPSASNPAFPQLDEPVQPVIGPDGRPMPNDQPEGVQGVPGMQGVPLTPTPAMRGSPTSPPVDNINVPPYPFPPDEPAAAPETPAPSQPTGVPFPGMTVPSQDPRSVPTQDPRTSPTEQASPTERTSPTDRTSPPERASPTDSLKPVAR